MFYAWGCTVCWEHVTLTFVSRNPWPVLMESWLPSQEQSEKETVNGLICYSFTKVSVNTKTGIDALSESYQWGQWKLFMLKEHWQSCDTGMYVLIFLVSLPCPYGKQQVWRRAFLSLATAEWLERVCPEPATTLMELPALINVSERDEARKDSCQIIAASKLPQAWCSVQHYQQCLIKQNKNCKKTFKIVTK